MYCVLTSQETPLSVGLSFRLIPSFFIGVTTSSSSRSSSSSGARGGLTLGGLIKQTEKDYQNHGIRKQRSKKSFKRVKYDTCIHWGQAGPVESQDLAQQKV